MENNFDQIAFNLNCYYIAVSVIIIFLSFNTLGLTISVRHFLAIVIICLAISSPYSISLTDLRQGKQNLTDLGFLNSVNMVCFSKIFGFSLMDWMSIAYIICDFNRVIMIASKGIFLLVSGLLLMGTFSYFLGIKYIPTQMDNVADILAAMRPFVLLLVVTAAYSNIVRISGLDKLIKALIRIMVVYLFSSVIFMLFIPQQFTWMKYEMKFLFIDQNDTVLVLFLFAYFLSRHQILFAVLVGAIPLMSGVKGAVVGYGMLLIPYLFNRFKLSQIIFPTVLMYVVSIVSVSMLIGYLGYDVSIYTRYHQIENLNLIYNENPFLVFTGLGWNKTIPVVIPAEFIDTGAYVEEEVVGNLMRGFQMPFMSWYRSGGVVALILSLFIFTWSNSKMRLLEKKLNCVQDCNRVVGLLLLPLTAFGVSLDFPLFGNKIVIIFGLTFSMVFYWDEMCQARLVNNRIQAV